jgi:hypothetical protein
MGKSELQSLYRFQEYMILTERLSVRLIKMNKKIILGMFMLTLFAVSIASLDTVMAANVDIPGSDFHNAHQNAGEVTQYQFRQRTQLKINSSSPIDVNMDVDAMAIGEKTFSIEITEVENNEDIELNMTCRQTEAELGVQNGATVRNRVRAQLNYGFAMNITANKTCHALMKMTMTQTEAKTKTWAYFDEEAEEWIPVDSEYVDGELVADTEHFSVWSIIELGTDYTAYIVIGVVGVAALGIIFALKRKH